MRIRDIHAEEQLAIDQEALEEALCGLEVFDCPGDLLDEIAEKGIRANPRTGCAVASYLEWKFGGVWMVSEDYTEWRPRRGYPVLAEPTPPIAAAAAKLFWSGARPDLVWR